MEYPLNILFKIDPVQAKKVTSALLEILPFYVLHMIVCIVKLIILFIKLNKMTKRDILAQTGRICGFSGEEELNQRLETEERM